MGSSDGIAAVSDMRRIPRTTLEQWAVLRAVIDHGGFAQAAEALHRSQSSVSYAVARLREGLGIDPIRIDGRKAFLTPAGRTLLNNALPLIDDMLRLERRAQTVVRGVEAEITVAIDELFPREALLAALSDLQRNFPDTDIDLHAVTRLHAARLAERRYDLAVALWSPDMPPNEWMVDVELLPVARAGHPLTISGAQPDQALLSLHRVAVVAGEEALSTSPAIVSGTVRQWQANGVAGAIDMVESGLCWAWLPAHRIKDGIAHGRLAPLDLATGNSRTMRLCLVLADRATAGPAARALCDLLKCHAADQLRRSA